MAIRNPPTEEQLMDARSHLYVALVQSISSDDPMILGHVRDALLALGGTPPDVVLEVSSRVQRERSVS
jgi:hypothetical protein